MKKIIVKIPSALAKKIKGSKEKFVIAAIKERIRRIKKRD